MPDAPDYNRTNKEELKKIESKLDEVLKEMNALDKISDELKIQVLSENAHSFTNTFLYLIAGIFIGGFTSYLSYYLEHQSTALLTYLVNVSLLAAILFISYICIDYIYKGRIETISSYIEEVEKGNRLPTLKQMFRKKTNRN
jgi:uncharacterized membrane protein YraQ (UPF0718 family)